MNELRLRTWCMDTETACIETLKIVMKNNASMQKILNIDIFFLVNVRLCSLRLPHELLNLVTNLMCFNEISNAVFGINDIRI